MTNKQTARYMSRNRHKGNYSEGDFRHSLDDASSHGSDGYLIGADVERGEVRSF